MYFLFPGFYYLLLVTCFCICLPSNAFEVGEKIPECAGPFLDYKDAPLFPHPENCTKYLECDYYGYLVETECGIGTRFEPKLNVCIHKVDDC